ncbi:hypothetical protein [Natronorubrum thiooxidans]|uniref:Uncharacterized protein n=1 Tax=Natronorubrum thiooxidans TaxID=308853 RepID=A0A1N7G795_9EURY|nr:hypothetical protein [Natronorubrum thiooxidans]SIS08384.1 hypothetical protein SAMN05421752_11054 [Natronorubrum thiooxidans]
MSRRQRPSRRTVLQTLGSLGMATVATSTTVGADLGRGDDRAGDTRCRSTRDTPDDIPDGATRYVAVVDRIVDDRHVVLLLEDGGELVDQHVEPRVSFEAIAERDILQVVLNDDSLLAYTHLSKRPGRSASSEQDRVVSDLAAYTASNPSEQD